MYDQRREVNHELQATLMLLKTLLFAKLQF